MASSTWLTSSTSKDPWGVGGGQRAASETHPQEDPDTSDRHDGTDDGRWATDEGRPTVDERRTTNDEKRCQMSGRMRAVQALPACTKWQCK
eukprot:6673875-Alexandrium_andersonii.AAC.1